MKVSRPAAVALIIVAAAAATELAMGRHPICSCGTTELFVAGRDSPKTSQMLADWYSLSHIVHGLLFYAFLWLVARRIPIGWRFAAAVGIEATWEVLENTPMVIDRYRQTAAALGYNGDSILNSMSDIAMTVVGFLLARRLPLWAAILAVATLEIVPLFVIRDNLTLNVWNLLAPNRAIASWQAGG